MIKIDYRNFEVQIRSSGNPGWLTADLALPRQLGEPLRDVRIESEQMPEIVPTALSDEEKQRALGKRLYKAIFGAASTQFPGEDILPGDTLHLRLAVAREVLRCERENRLQDDGRPARLGVRLVFRAAAGALPNTPVELLCSRRSAAKSGDFLALDSDTPVVRAPWPPGEFGQDTLHYPLRILVALSEPPGLNFGAKKVKEELEKTFQKIGHLVAVDYLEAPEPVTYAALRDRLQGIGVPHRDGFQDFYSIFHFLGHGTYSQEMNPPQGFIILQKPTGEELSLPGYKLKELLAASSVKMAILQACQTAQTGTLNAFHGVAQQLAEGGLPCTIAMQYEISSPAAQTFFCKLYEHWLGQDLVLEEAVTRARLQLYEDTFSEGIIDDPTAWLAPVLFLTSEIQTKGGGPILPPEKQKKADDLRDQIRFAEQAIAGLKENLELAVDDEEAKPFRIGRELFEKQLDDLKEKLGAVLGTYLDLGTVTVQDELGQSVPVPVKLSVHDHQPSKVEFQVEWESERLEFDAVHSPMGNACNLLENAAGRIKVRIFTAGGALVRDNKKIAELQFKLKSRFSSTPLTIQKVQIYEGGKLVSRQASTGGKVVIAQADS